MANVAKPVIYFEIVKATFIRVQDAGWFICISRFMDSLPAPAPIDHPSLESRAAAANCDVGWTRLRVSSAPTCHRHRHGDRNGSLASNSWAEIML